MPKKASTGRKFKAPKHAAGVGLRPGPKSRKRCSKRRKSDQTASASAKTALRRGLEKDIDLLKNSRGHARSYDENKVILCVLFGLFLDALKAAPKGEDVPWTPVEADTARLCRCQTNWPRELRKNYEEDGTVLVSSTDCVGRGSPNYVDNARKLSPLHLVEIDAYCDRSHKNGVTVTVISIKNWLDEKYAPLAFAAGTIRYALVHFLDRGWSVHQRMAYMTSEERQTQMRTYLRDYASALKQEKEGSAVVVYTDESYVNQNHHRAQTWLKVDGDGRINNKAGKGLRLILLHAITKDGPLGGACEISWTGDTPHPSVVVPDGGAPTAELIWKAQSSTGDYHDNMDGQMFLKWAEEKLLPAFNYRYPGKKMILVLDNARYHHVCGIPALASLGKQQLLELMQEHGMEDLALPATEKRDAKRALPETQLALPRNRRRGVRVVRVRVPTKVQVDDAMMKRGGVYVPTAEEMRGGFISYLKADPELAKLLECKLKQMLLDDGGHELLFTAPYAFWSQPIELFWAAGKNPVAAGYHNERSLKEVVDLIHGGWYGGVDGKNGVRCGGLVDHAIRECNKRIATVGGLEGTVGDLRILEGAVFTAAAGPHTGDVTDTGVTGDRDLEDPTAVSPE